MLLSSADRVVGLTVNFALNVIISRLLTPSEVGVALIGTATAVVAIGIRDFATPAYLVQKPEIDATDVRTTTALNVILGVVVAALLMGVAPLMQRVYGDPRLTTFFTVVAIANIVEASMAPMQSLLQRDMKFR
ncbi:MAG: oligosaccharide flippase family protein, partial [Hyphomicrobiaceae bacterium]|nr:oligosaccharide flippase family protein [Hyphomicrobiaceae bacterium]